jgi:DNA-binding NarL/FixJ family response regulator
MSKQNIRVLLVDDHAVVIDGIRLMLRSVPQIEVTGTAATAAEALDLVRKQDFEVALVDIGLPDKNGLELLKRLRIEKPQLAVLILSMFAEDIYALRALKLGACGFLSKNSGLPLVLDAVQKVAAGGKYISPAMVDIIAALLSSRHAGRHEDLSNRELDVLRMLAVGESVHVIASTLHLSPSTVSSYRSRILGKTGMKNNVQLARYATENGLLE